MFFVFIAIVLFPELLSKKTVLALLVYTAAVFLVYLRGNSYYDSIAKVIVPSMQMLSALIITEYTFKFDLNYKYTKTVLLTVLITNMIMIVISIPQLLINPNIIRGANTFGIDDNEKMVYYWIISYETIHGLPFIFAPLILFCRKFYHKKKKFLFYAFVIFMLLFIVYKSNATTPLVLSLIMIIVGFTFNFKKLDTKSVLKILFFTFLSVFILSSNIMVPILTFSQEVLDPGSSNYKKIQEIKDSYTYGDADGDLELRQGLYTQSKELFFDEPLLGTSRSELISMHTWIWDQLACMGIIFFSTFVILFVIHVKAVSKSMNYSKIMYLCSIASLVGMLFYKNSFGSGTWLYGFAILPVLCRYIDHELYSYCAMK